jgi:hypothetical protein
MEYNTWKWTTNNEKMIKTQRKRKLLEIEENIRDIQINNLRKINSKEINNKELCAKRLSEREQVKQRTFNPFLCNNNYLSDLATQENFLKPKNSSFECLEQ